MGGLPSQSPQAPPMSYRDFSLVPYDSLTSKPPQTIASSTCTNGSHLSFPMKLHLMLDSVELEGKAGVIGWEAAHGRCFKVYNHRRFVRELLPRFFRQTKWESFQRQLNIYGFKRLTVGPDKGAYFHERFLRWRPQLALTIKRIKLKGTGPRKPAAPHLEPDFYVMPPVQPPQQQLPPQSNPGHTATQPTMASASLGTPINQVSSFSEDDANDTRPGSQSTDAPTEQFSSTPMSNAIPLPSLLVHGLQPFTLPATNHTEYQRMGTHPAPSADSTCFDEADADAIIQLFGVQQELLEEPRLTTFSSSLG